MRFLCMILLPALLLPVSQCSAKAPDAEFRAVWVHTWLPGLLSRAEIDETIRWAGDCNMNALVLQARRIGDAYYNSAHEPRAANIQDGPEFDPLGYAVAEAHKSGMQVYAWFNVYRVWTTNVKPTQANHVINLHPEWLSKDANGATSSSDGQFLDPGVPQVREYLARVAADLVGKCGVDGLMLDFVRYPGKTWGYNDIAVARFNELYGRKGKPSPDDPLWCRWRREQVTETVRAIRKEITRVRPSVKLAAATIAWGPCPSDFTKTDAYSFVFQDWRLWMEEGLLDANMPMNYKDPSSAKTSKYYEDWLVGMRRWSYGRHVYCGLMVFKDNVSGVASQVKAARDKGVEGIVGFAFSQIGCKSSMASKLKGTVFAEPAPCP